MFEDIGSFGITQYASSNNEYDRAVTEKLQIEMQSTMRQIEITSEFEATSQTQHEQSPVVNPARQTEPILIAESPELPTEQNKATSIGEELHSLPTSSLDINIYEGVANQVQQALPQAYYDFLASKKNGRVVVQNS